jgi:septal ring factor EnvC (AmiA/AmiB activator)
MVQSLTMTQNATASHPPKSFENDMSHTDDRWRDMVEYSSELDQQNHTGEERLRALNEKEEREAAERAARLARIAERDATSSPIIKQEKQ